MSDLKVKILTHDKVVFDKNVVQATIPVKGGLVTILKDHIPYIGVLKTGEIILLDQKSKKEYYLAISSGIVTFSNNHLIILADRAERAEDIDIKRAKEAYRSALKETTERAANEEVAQTTALLEKESNRIEVAKRHRS